MRAAGLCVLLSICAACGGRQGAADPLAELGLDGDAPFDLAEDQDLELARADLAALPDDSPARPALRRRVADELARRLAAALEHGAGDDADAALRSLLSLWSADELRAPEAIGRELARHRAALTRARETHARAGRDRHTAAALCALVLAEPARAGGHRAELDEILAYGEELDGAGGDEARRPPRSIELLDSVVEVHPAPWLVDRLVALYLAHQAASASAARRAMAGERLFARGDPAWRTAWHVTRVLARAGRLADARRAIAGLDGIGDDRELRERLRRALAPAAGVADWVLLAARFHASDARRADFGAALAIAREAVRRFPRAAAAHLAAADSARLAGQPALAIRFYESGLALDPVNAGAAAELGRLYVARISALAQTDRPAAAGRVLARFERFHRAAARALGSPVQPDPADARAALGRGLVALGELDRARRVLSASLEQRQTLDALESVGTIELKQDRFAAAAAVFDRGLTRPAAEVLDRFQQIRLMRLAAEAHEGAGEAGPARARYLAAMAAWRALLEDPGLPAGLAGEALVEQGRILWRLGDRRSARMALDAAVDVDPDGASVYADAVAFLIVHGEYERAVDAYHRALGSRGLGDYFKVYMSLWVVAEARRLGRPPDPLARDYLAARDGTLWYDALARYAAGRIRLEDLRRRATTRSRRAELLYYSAVLGDMRRDPDRARRLLRGVLGTDMVTFFEYDMAKHWLRNGFGERRE